MSDTITRLREGKVWYVLYSLNKVSQEEYKLGESWLQDGSLGKVVFCDTARKVATCLLSTALKACLKEILTKSCIVVVVQSSRCFVMPEKVS